MKIIAALLLASCCALGPGEHHLCAMGRLGVWKVISFHGAKTEAGMIYYFTINSVDGIHYIDYSLRPADADEGRYLVAGGSLALLIQNSEWIRLSLTGF